jgi:beta-alanine degradation protein BauB
MSERAQAKPVVHIDEPHVRVTEYRFAPGAETGWHRHPADYVILPLADGDLLLEEPGGKTRTARLTRHVPYARREGVEHNVVNANAVDYAFIEVEHLHSLGDDPARKALLVRFVEAWNGHDLDGLMACFTEDCVFWSSSGPHPQGGIFEGREAVAKASGAIFEAFADAAWTESRTTLLGDRALGEWTFVGTAKDGTRTRVLGIDVLDLSGDKIQRKNSFRKNLVQA